MLSETKTSQLFSFIVFVCYSLYGNLVAVASRWLLKYSILKLNDVLDAVRSTWGTVVF